MCKYSLKICVVSVVGTVNIVEDDSVVSNAAVVDSNLSEASLALTSQIESMAIKD